MVGICRKLEKRENAAIKLKKKKVGESMRVKMKIPFLFLLNLYTIYIYIYMVYIIKAKYRSGGDAEGQYNILKEWGDFRSTIDFTVHLEGNDAVKPTGIIVQKIEK